MMADADEKMTFPLERGPKPLATITARWEADYLLSDASLRAISSPDGSAVMDRLGELEKAQRRLRDGIKGALSDLGQRAFSDTPTIRAEATLRELLRPKKPLAGGDKSPHGAEGESSDGHSFLSAPTGRL